MPSPHIGKTFSWAVAIVVVLAVIGLAVVGQQWSPPQQGQSGSQSSEPCKIEALSEMRSAAEEWCANGLFGRVAITGDKKNIIAVAQFSSNGSQLWQIQSNGLLATFPGLTDKIAAAANGRDVAVSVHNAADLRVAACARANTEPESTCEVTPAR